MIRSLFLRNMSTSEEHKAMTTTLEDEVVLLYALFVCGGKPSRARATHFILTNDFIKTASRDHQIVSTGESRLENRIAWTRQNLKDKGELSMPNHGTWAITEKGKIRILK